MADVVGLDIGSYAIKAAVVRRGFGNPELETVVSKYNPVGLFAPSDEGQKQQLATTIKELANEAHFPTKQVNVALPESVAYTSIISMPYLSDAELASSIHWEAEQHIPVPLSEVNLEYDVLYKPTKGDEGEKMRVLLVAARKQAIEQLVALMQAAALEVVGVETGLLSIHRALGPTLSKGGSLMICHVGALSTDLMVVVNGEPVLTYTIQTGGLALTRTIEKNLGLPPQQAEEYKRTYGLDPTQLEGKVRQVMAPVVNILVAEVRKAMQYFQTAHAMQGVQSMLLTGGSAYLPGLSSFLAEAFGYEVVLGNPLEQLPLRHGVQMPETIGAFAPAIGLALRSE